MKRRLLNFLTALSLLLCVAVVALWVRSRFAADQLAHTALAVSPNGFRCDEYTMTAWRDVLSVAIFRHEFDRASLPDLVYGVRLRECRGRHARNAQSGVWT